MKTEHPSANGRFLLAVDVKAGVLSLKEGEQVRWSVKWPQGAPPYTVRVSDDGKRVVLMGTYHEGEHGEIGGNERDLVILKEDGQMLAAYRGSDLRLEGNLSSTKGLRFAEETVQIDPATNQLRFLRSILDDTHYPEEPVFLNVPMAFDLETGDQVEVLPGERDALEAPLRAAIREKLASKDAHVREQGAEQAGVLRDKDSVPQLLKLLDDKAVTALYQYGDNPQRELPGVRIAAANALALILGKEAIPLFQERLKTATGADRGDWIAVLESLGVAPEMEDLERQITSKSGTERQEALIKLENMKSPRALAMARRLIHDPDKMARLQAFTMVCNLGTAEDLPSIRAALADPDLAVFAIRGIARLDPAGSEKTLIALMKDENSPAQWDATQLMAERANPKALNALVRWVAYWPAHPQEVKESPGSLMDMMFIARILADHAPAGAKEALQKALSVKDPWWCTDIHARGALAKLGERPHLTYLRTVAAGKEPEGVPMRGEMTRRVPAIEWLGMAKDRDSLALLRELLNDNDRFVREAAQAALKQIEGSG